MYAFAAAFKPADCRHRKRDSLAQQESKHLSLFTRVGFRFGAKDTARSAAEWPPLD